MAIQLSRPDEMGMNMTPMIDIVFNLVQFFMLTLDLSHKEMAILDLPRANNGIEEKGPDLQKVRDHVALPPRFTVNLRMDGVIEFKGIQLALAVIDPAVQDAALVQLRAALRALAATAPRDPETGASTAMVLIRGDRAAKWKYVQWIMQVCADPQIRIFRLHFAVEHSRKER